MHEFGRNIAVFADSVDDSTDARHIHAVNLNLLFGRLGRLHNLRQSGGERHLVGEVHVAATQKFLYLGTGGVHTRQNRENRLLTLANFLVEHVVNLENFYKSRRSEDDHNGIDFLEFLFTIVDGNAEMFGHSRRQNVDGIGDARTRQQLFLQFVGSFSR